MIEALTRRPPSEEELAPVFDELTVWSSRFGALLFDHLEIRPAIRGLDLGCATGFPLIELARVHGPGSHFVGVDIWDAALEVVRRKVEVEQLGNVEVRRADAAELPFADESFDLITANLGINNFGDPGKVLAESFRVARRGARIVLTTNPIGTLPEVYEEIRRVLGDVAPDSVRELDREERHRGTIESVQSALGAAGFRVTRTIPGHFQMQFADGTALLHHRLCGCFLEGWRKAVPQEQEARIFTAVEAALNERAAGRGSLRGSVAMVYLEAERPA